MGVRFATALPNAGVPVLPASAAETILFTTNPLTLPYDAATVFLIGQCAMLLGTGTAALIFQIRRGPLLTSPVIGGTTFTVTAAAGQNVNVPIISGDINSGPSQPQYSWTIQQTGATAAGVVNAGVLIAFVL